MKHVGSFFSRLTAYGVALLITSIAVTAYAQDKEGTAKVMAIRGSAQYSEAGGAWMPLKVGKVLKSGAVIKTAEASQVDLFLKNNGPVVRVTADTTLGLDKLLYNDTGADVIIDTQLNLTNGRILGNVKKMAATSKYDVKIPTGTVGIRGTDYDISTTGQVIVTDGSVLVTYIQGGQTYQMTVNAGQTFNPPTTPGQPPTVTATDPQVFNSIVAQIKDLMLIIPPVIEGGGTTIITPIQTEPPVSPTEGTGGHPATTGPQ